MKNIPAFSAEYQSLLAKDFRSRVYPLALLCTSIFLAFFLLNVSHAGNPNFIVLDLVAAAVFLLTGWAIRRGSVQPFIGSALILGMMMVLFVMIILYPDFTHPILYYQAVIPFFAFFMMGSKGGRIHAAMMLAALLFLWFGGSQSWFDIQYSTMELSVFLLLLLFSTISAWIFERVREKTFYESYQQGLRQDALLQAIEEVYYRVGMDGIIQEIGDAILSLTGYQPSEVEGRPITMFYANPSERESYVQALAQHGKVKNYPIEVIGKYGQHVMILMSSRIVFNEKAEPLYVEGMFRDITKDRKLEIERKENLDHLRALSVIESDLTAPDIEHAIQQSLEDMRQMFAVDRVFLVPVNGYAYPESFTAALMTTHEEYPFDIASFMQENEIVTYLASMPKHFGNTSLIIDTTDMLSQYMLATYQIRSQLMLLLQIKPGVIWLLAMQRCQNQELFTTVKKRLFVDVSHRIRGALGQLILQKDLHATVARVEIASKAKSEFLATMSHELRTPLHGVIGLLDLLAEDKKDFTAEQLQHLSLAQSSAHVLSSLIDDVLDLAKVESGKIELQKQSFVLKDALYGALVPFVMKARERGLNLSLEMKCVAEMVEGDVVRLRQILLNLVGNAIKFTFEGYVRIVVSQDDEMLQINIEDSGIGIEKRKQAEVFKPFSQVHDIHVLGDNLQEKGTGLGTTISQHFVEIMGGTLSLKSEPNIGTTFIIRIPLRQLGEERVTAVLHMEDFSLLTKNIDAEDKKENLEKMRLGQCSVLLAEDDPVGRRIAIKRLERAGFVVTAVADGFAAWESVRNSRFDLLLTDVRMPGLDGMELTKSVRMFEQEHGLPRMLIVGLSAYALEEVKADALACGMDEFVSKPVDMDALLLKLEDCCEKSSAQVL